MDLILDFTETEILYTNKWFESELSDAIQKDYRHDNKLEFYSSVVDKLCRAKIVRHKTEPTVTREISWYQDAVGELWYYEIPSRWTKNGKPRVVDCSPPTTPYKQDFEGKDKTIGAIYDCPGGAV